jgi:metastasis-associated protein MTA
LDRDDCYFYTLVYDPQQKTLLADRGEIRVGNRFQAESLPKVLAEGEEDGRDLSQLEELEYTPDNPLSDREIEQFLTIVKSVGTFARALDHSSSVKQPSLHMSAATASRDVTIAHAMKVLHQCDYDIGKAVLALVPASGPVLCRDEMEDWSASEANLFEEAMEKERYEKDFTNIRADCLPWKSLRSIVEYYYMWKTTDRYVQQKRVKAVEAESKLKQVYIPVYNQKPHVTNGANGNLITDNSVAAVQGRNCESCAKPTSSQWYAWGPAHVQCRLCHGCWFYWKKFGGLKYASKLDAEKVMNASAPTPNATTGSPAVNNHVSNNNNHSPRSDGQVVSGGKGGDGQYPCSECGKVFNRQERLMAHMAAHRPHRCNYNNCGKEFKFKAHLVRHCAQAHGIVVRSGSPRPIMKTRAAFYLSTNEATKVARRTCAHLFRPRHAARKPFQPINAAAIKAECKLKTRRRKIRKKKKKKNKF